MKLLNISCLRTLTLAMAFLSAAWAAGPGDGGGAGSGNRMLMYASITGIAVQYREGLQAEEMTGGGVRVCNASEATGQKTESCETSSDAQKPVSKVEITIAYPKLTDLDSLKRILRTREPNTPFESIAPINGMEGFVSRSATTQTESQHARIYLFHKSGAVILAEIEAFEHQNGIQEITNVLGTVALDIEPPVIQKIEVDRNRVEVGPDKAPFHITISGTDDVSGISVTAPAQVVVEAIGTSLDRSDSEDAFRSRRMTLEMSVIHNPNGTFTLVAKRPDDYRFRESGPYVILSVRVEDHTGKEVTYTAQEVSSEKRTSGLKESKRMYRRIGTVKQASERDFGRTEIPLVVFEYSDSGGADFVPPEVREFRVRRGFDRDDANPFSLDGVLQMRVTDDYSGLPDIFHSTISLSVKTFADTVRVASIPGYWIRLQGNPGLDGWFDFHMDTDPETTWELNSLRWVRGRDMLQLTGVSLVDCGGNMRRCKNQQFNLDTGIWPSIPMVGTLEPDQRGPRIDVMWSSPKVWTISEANPNIGGELWADDDVSGLRMGATVYFVQPDTKNFTEGTPCVLVPVPGKKRGVYTLRIQADHDWFVKNRGLRWNVRDITVFDQAHNAAQLDLTNSRTQISFDVE